eukprot:gb/GECH01004718.1/.p1 GENE.gb/GECH01004718.1/~~gb/GECH01004718.1/.p1  ORF type:complete len:450 (+),score=61.33 gb/GECH01004718.1/:1-1350(+)
MSLEQKEFQSIDFGITEPLVTSFGCNLALYRIATRGRLYVTPNHICFYGKHVDWSQVKRVLCFKDISSITQPRYILSRSALHITSVDGSELQFTSFNRGDSAYAVLSHLHKYRESGPERFHRLQRTLAPHTRQNLLGSSQGRDQANGPLDRSIMLAERSQDAGNATLEQLDRQGNKLDRTREDLKDMDQSLARSARVIRGFSLTGAIRNAFTSSTSNPSPPEYIQSTSTHRRSRSNSESSKRSKNSIDIVKMHQHTFNIDTYSLKEIIFFHDYACIIDSQDTSYRRDIYYKDITSVELLPQPLHICIKQTNYKDIILLTIRFHDIIIKLRNRIPNNTGSIFSGTSHSWTVNPLGTKSTPPTADNGVSASLPRSPSVKEDDDLDQALQQRQQLEGGLDFLLQRVGTLKETAHLLGDEMDRHSEVLDDMDQLLDRNSARARDNTRKLNRYT